MNEVRRLVVGPLATNCYVIDSGSELAVVDPGGDAEQIIAVCNELGGKVRYVINTHGHIDHVAADKAVLEATGAELLIHAADEAMVTRPDAVMAGFFGMSVSPVRPARLLQDGERISVGGTQLEVVHTPGHTPGGICLVGAGVAFTGDTLFVDSVGRTDFPGGSEMQLRASLQLLRSRLTRETMLYPGHGEPGSFARALLVNPFLGAVW